MHETLDPVRLLREIRAAQQRLIEIADGNAAGMGAPPTAPSLEQFLAGLRTAWRKGEVRPTAQPTAKATRERRRPDPLMSVTALLHGWYEAEPWRTSRELLDRLQVEQPGIYPNGLLRTVQRRMKGWRRDMAHAPVFGPTPDGEPTDVDGIAVAKAVP